MSKITYVPGPDDRVETIAYGRKWKANVPVEIADTAGYAIMESVRSERPDGTVVLTTRERKVTILEMARGNPSFQIEGETKAAVKTPSPREMSTPGEYRAYAQHWFRDETSAGAFKERWADEEELREQCGMTHDDVRFLEPFMNARLHELTQAAKEERAARRRA